MTGKIIEFKPASGPVDRAAVVRAREQYAAGEISRDEMFEVWRCHLRHQGNERYFEVIRAVYLAVQGVLRPEVRS